MAAQWSSCLARRCEYDSNLTYAYAPSIDTLFSALSRCLSIPQSGFQTLGAATSFVALIMLERSRDKRSCESHMLRRCATGRQDRR
jgi:hypothetical protein